MGATIRYRLLTDDNLCIPVSTPSAFITAMTRVFGAEPWKLKFEHIPLLNAMSATADRDDNVYHRIVRLIENQSASVGVEIWHEY